MKLTQLLDEVRACTICSAHLPCGPRPLVQASPAAELIIIGQAPGQRAHDSGVPWGDASGNRLRDWLGLNDEQFYNPHTMALMPMGFCYPGMGKAGDLPPRAECAPAWHSQLLDHLPNLQLTILIGKYAIDKYAPQPYRTLTAAVQDYDNMLPTRIALPHPSPRNNRWLAKNLWFTSQVIPVLKSRVRQAIKTG